MSTLSTLAPDGATKKGSTLSGLSSSGDSTEGASNWKPGEWWNNPIDDEHPELSFTTRLKLKSLADTGPATLKKNLENEGFEAKHRGGMSFSIRKPGEKLWYVVDPSTFEPLDDTLEFLGSIAPSVAGQLYAGGKGTVVGGYLGGAPGAVVGGLVGAGGGAAAGEAAKMAAGKALGIEYVPEEVGSRLESELAFGAAGELLGPAVGKLVGAGKRALVGGGAKEGLLPAAARKFQEARVAKTLLEGPERKARSSFAGGAQEAIDKAFAETSAVSEKELGKKAAKLEAQIAKGQEEGLDTSVLEGRLTRIQEAQAVEAALKSAEKGVVGAEKAVGTAGKKVTGAQKRIDKWSSEIADLEAEIGRREAVLKRAAGNDAKVYSEQLDDLTRELDRWDTWTKEHKSITGKIKRLQGKLADAEAGVASETAEIGVLKKGLPKLEKSLNAARKAKRAAQQALDKSQKVAASTVMPEVEPLAKQAFIKNLAEDAGADVAGKNGDQIVKALDELITDEKYANYLRTGQDPVVRDAIDKQVKGIIGALDPEEEFFVKFARREPKGVEVPPEERYFREMNASRDIPFDEAAYNQAVQDLEGKTLDEMRELLDRAGWTGEVPPNLNDITDALYRARVEGITGRGMGYDPQAYQLGGPPLEKGVGTVYDTEAGARRLFGRPEVTELRVGGQNIPIGREFAEQQVAGMGPIQRAIAQPPGIARQAARGLQRLRTGASKTLEGAAQVAGLPGKGLDKAVTKLSKLATPEGGKGPGLAAVGGIGTALYATGLAGVAGKAFGAGIASKIVAGGLRGISKAIMADPQTLVALARKATGPIADKLRVPLSILQSRGEQAYKAAVFSMLHDPHVRGFLQDLEMKEEK